MQPVIIAVLICSILSLALTFFRRSRSLGVLMKRSPKAIEVVIPVIVIVTIVLLVAANVIELDVGPVVTGFVIALLSVGSFVVSSALRERR
jgi:hypothetical protein